MVPTSPASGATVPGTGAGATTTPPPASSTPPAATAHGSGSQFGVIGGGAAGATPPGAVPPGAAPAPVSAPASGGGSGRTAAIAVVCTTAVIALVAALVVVVLKPFDDDSSDQTSSGPSSEQTDDLATTTSSTTTSTTSSTTTSTTTTMPPTTTAPVDPQAAALTQLQATKQADASEVADILDYWVPQISSKQVGLPADGIVYQNDTILKNHQNLVDQLSPEPVALLWSGDFSTFQSKDFWVTIVATPFSTSDEVLSWCVSHGFDADNCNAKIVSKTHDTSDSTERLSGG
jgi:serine/threonine-protein kinase